jgi:hypothetical protein
MDSYSTLPLHKPYDIRRSILWWYFQTHVDVVGHRMTLQHFRSFLSAQIPKNPAYSRPELAINFLSAMLRNEHDVVLSKDRFELLDVVQTLVDKE